MPLTLERIPHDKQVAVYSLHASGYSYKKIAKALDISTPTIGYICNQIPSDLNEVERYKKGLVAWQYGVSQRAMCRITDDKLDAMNALQLMTINAIGIDKARDMEGHNRPQFNIVTIIGECKQTRDKLEAQMQSIQRARTSVATSAVEVQP